MHAYKIFFIILGLIILDYQLSSLFKIIFVKKTSSYRDVFFCPKYLKFHSESPIFLNIPLWLKKDRHDMIMSG